jgi:glucose-6-phosphate isomerase
VSRDAVSQAACETPFDALARAELPAWQETAAHAVMLRSTTLQELFAADPKRGTRLTVEACGIYLDYSKQRLTDETLQLLVKLARSCGVAERADAMFRGERINVTEGRAVLHVALRAPKSRQIFLDGEDVVPGVHATGQATPASRFGTSSTSASGDPTSVR